jgi:hypothetical protein
MRSIKAYLAVTAVVFGLLVVAHVLRVIEEGPRVLNIWWVLITVLAAGLCAWAGRLFLLVRRAEPPA